MKYTLSVTSRPTNWNAITFAVFWALITACAGFALLQMSSSAERQKQIAILEKQNEKIVAIILREHEAAGAIPSATELAELSTRIQWFNERAGASAAPTGYFLDALEQSLPQNVRLSALLYDRSEGDFLISLMSKTEESLLRLLPVLQDAMASYGVDLERQLTLDNADGRLYQYDVRIAVR